MNYQRSQALVAKSKFLIKLLPSVAIVIGLILASTSLRADTNIVWSDEFNGTSIDTTKWTFETGSDCPANCGWGNNELEYYTSRTNNAYVDGNGLLHIVAQQESYAGYNFTSARMKTQDLYNTPVYGRFEWRAKLPSGVGMWPALWLLGSDFPTVGWPGCGEIDVVENNGATPTWVQGSLHWGTSGEISRTQTYNFPSPDSVTNWHTYDLVWSPGLIQYFVDGTLYENDAGLSTPFNAPFFFIMNLAVGGNYVGNPTVAQIEAGTTFPAEMLVYYVRVYEQTAPMAIAVAPQLDGSLSLSWPTNIVCHLQVQTNSLVGGNWTDLPGTTSPYVVIPDPTQGTVFYRLASP
jgi:beta-glucanase (GH16 family)